MSTKSKQETNADEQVERPSLGEAYDAITGHEGRAVMKNFDGVSIDDMQLRYAEGELAASGVVILVQMHEFVHNLRDLKDEHKALRTVLGLSRAELLSILEAYQGNDEGDEIDADEPETESGKDDSSPV